MHEIVPVVLCGGSGTRLWPLSREGFPKQFLTFSGDKSLFQQAVSRVNNLNSADISIGNTLVVTNEEHRFLALEQVRELKNITAKFLLEPVSRNTAPALTLAALQANEDFQDPILVVVPADQTVLDVVAFSSALQRAIHIAAQGTIAILGITPDKPVTGYGYIKARDNSGALEVTAFTEKPDIETARRYLNQGGYYWNSGMFVLKASVWLSALNTHRSDIAAITTQSWGSRSIDSRFVRPNKLAFEAIAAESIDYAVIEKCPETSQAIQMVPLEAGWSDLGAWDAVWQVGEQDQKGNVTHGDAFLIDTSNTLVFASSRMVGTVGVKNLVIVETPDAILVTDKDQSQNVKHLVAELSLQKRSERTAHRKVHRPWGWYDSIDESERFKVKRILVRPGASLSLQKHHHRAEHWIVVKGTAEVTCGSKVTILSENQSTYIPLGEVHRLVNPGAIDLEIIEIQSGSYLGEDDIVRFEDNYGRAKA
jgi:mannose-1-phosphate guanylyltransferase / mannose-6-phosphate isomerase